MVAGAELLIQRRRRDVGLQAAAVAAVARTPVGVDRQVAELAGVAALPAVDLVAQNEATADAGAKVYEREAATTGEAAGPALTDGGGGRVVVQQHRKSHTLRHGVAQRDPFPPGEVRGADELSAGVGDRPGRGDTHAEQRVAFNAGPLYR